MSGSIHFRQALSFGQRGLVNRDSGSPVPIDVVGMAIETD